MRCREVCPEWRVFLEERRLCWLADLPTSSGMDKLTDSLVRAGSRRAGGQLRVLRVNGWPKARALRFETL